MRTPSDILRLPHPQWQKRTQKAPKGNFGRERKPGLITQDARQSWLWENEQLWLEAQAGQDPPG